MSTTNHKNAYRWVLLRHIGAPNDVKGIHYDLLLEDDDFCRTWRLSDIPIVDGSCVNALHINPHKLEWLNIKEKVLSSNRGVVTRVKKGFFWSSLQDIQNSFINLSLQWEYIDVNLVIDKKGCRLVAKQK